MNLKIRFALDSDGSTLKAFLAQGDRDVEGIEFVGIEGFWLLAETDRIVGCLQLAHSRPYSVAESMLVCSELRPYVRAKVFKKLVDASMSVFKYLGSDGMVSQVPFADKAFKRALKKRGWVTISSGNYMARSL